MALAGDGHLGRAHIGWVIVYFKEDDPHKTEAGISIMEEARFRNGCEVEGVFHDRISMGLLRAEWEAGRGERA